MKFITQFVEVPHADFAEITRMVLIEEDPVVVHASSVTASSRVLSVLPDTTMPGADVAPLLTVLLESGCHLSLAGTRKLSSSFFLTFCGVHSLRGGDFRLGFLSLYREV